MEKVLLDLINNRRSCRHFEPDRSVGDELVTQIIGAGVRASSASNRQPWRFYVVSNKDKLQEIRLIASQVLGSGAGSEDNVFYSAPLVIFLTVAGASGGWELFDAGLCCAQMQLGAMACGLATCPVGLVALREADLRDALHIDFSERFVIALAVGYPARPPGKKTLREPKLYWWHSSVGSDVLRAAQSIVARYQMKFNASQKSHIPIGFIPYV